MPENITIPNTGGLDSPDDPRHWTLASVGAPTGYPDAVFIDHVTEMPVSMQASIGACVGCTFEEIKRLQVFNETGQWLTLSWRFVYAMCKALEGKKVTNPDGTVSDYTMFSRTAGANDGTYPTLAAIVVRKYGVPLEQYCPNDTSLSPDDFCYQRELANIPQAALDDAATRKGGADFTVGNTENEIKRAISYAKANNGAVAILRAIGDTYWKDANGQTTYDKARLIPISVPAYIVSGHEELVYGYDTDHTNGRVRIYWLNHWSDMWCSTGGTNHDGGRAWEYLDVWLKNVREVRVYVPKIPNPSPTFKYTFMKHLAYGMQGPDVVALQHVLKLEGCFDYPTFTGNFLTLTKLGVKKLQEKYADAMLKPLNLSAGTGYVGDLTLKWLNEKYGA